MTTQTALARLRARWWIPLVGGFLGVTLAFAVVSALPRTYEAEAEVLLREESADTTLDGPVQPIIDASVPTYIDLMGSDDARQEINSASGMTLSSAELESRVRLEPAEGSAVIRITAQASDAHDAARLADAASTAFASVVQDTPLSSVPLTMHVVTTPEQPTKPSAPNTGAFAAAGVCAGIVIGVLIALSMATAVERRGTPAEVAI